MKDFDEIMKDPVWKGGIMVIIIVLSILMVHSCFGEEIDLETIKQIESHGNPLAFNEKSGARGLFQITEICLEDYNNYHLVKFEPENLFTARLNRKIAKWYLTERIPSMLKYYNKPVTIENIIIAYNAGISYVAGEKELPEETKEYIKKYHKLTGGRND